jgi:hypothetical protein
MMRLRVGILLTKEVNMLELASLGPLLRLHDAISNAESLCETIRL